MACFQLGSARASRGLDGIGERVVVAERLKGILVTYVDDSLEAIKVVAQKADKFDFILIDKDVSEVDVLKFLRITRNLNIPSIVMSEQDDDALESEAIKNGAIRTIKRPLTIKVVNCIRHQFIMERMYKHSGSKRKFESFDEGNNIGNGNHNFNDMNISKKTYVQWTEELHQKFLNAVHQIGKESCYPRQILDHMGVPGLTRAQVASHLQGRCRPQGVSPDTAKVN
ncbi:two-component response regulator ARR12-like [Rutidosis leptorrhynchoides]|uniref:two-component response regulator ARR12-like n=1 Tax=Rutidosis leptorrhynchoides TaxID=125765 RepID=UPI003A99BD23